MGSGVKVRSIFSESAIIPKERKQAFDKLGFKEFIQQGKIERKMKEDVYTNNSKRERGKSNVSLRRRSRHE